MLLQLVTAHNCRQFETLRKESAQYPSRSNLVAVFFRQNYDKTSVLSVVNITIVTSVGVVAVIQCCKVINALTSQLSFQTLGV